MQLSLSLLRNHCSSKFIIPFMTKRLFASEMMSANHEVAHVKSASEKEYLAISLLCSNPLVEKVDDFDHLKRVNFSRPKEETLSQTFERMKQNLQKKFGGKPKKQRKKLVQNNGGEGHLVQDEPDPNSPWVQLPLAISDQNGEVFPGDMFNEDAWKEGHVLSVGQSKFRIKVNQPDIANLKIGPTLYVGLHVTIKADLEFCKLSDCKYKWYMMHLSKRGDQKEDIDLHYGMSNWKLAGEGQHFLPTDECVGRHLLLVCTPVSERGIGYEACAISAMEVQECSTQVSDCLFSKRHIHTQDFVSPDSHEFRLVSYNILADMYTSMEETWETLFPWCPKDFLSMSYRKCFLLRELVGYKSDIICLQECDPEIFSMEFEPLLSGLGYGGRFLKKSGGVREGKATFFREAAFECVEHTEILINEVFRTNDLFTALRKKVENKSALFELVTSRSNVVLASLLKHKTSGKYLLVGNTHLYFRPPCHPVRLLQSYVSVVILEDLMKEYKLQFGVKDISLIFCGDFNSGPMCGVNRLMTEGFVPDSFHEYYSLGDACAVPDMGLSHSLDLASTIPATLENPCLREHFSTMVGGFISKIDYQFYDRTTLEVSRLIPSFAMADIEKYVAMPNQYVHSDHVAQVAEFKFK